MATIIFFIFLAIFFLIRSITSKTKINPLDIKEMIKRTRLQETGAETVKNWRNSLIYPMVEMMVIAMVIVVMRTNHA
jgi:hypothetical protein